VFYEVIDEFRSDINEPINGVIDDFSFVNHEDFSKKLDKIKSYQGKNKNE
jgi:hypothetical protein